MKENQMEWDRFCRLGERIGDGDMDADEARSVNREYKRLSILLIPEIAELENRKRKAKSESRDKGVANYISKHDCPKCAGKLKQSRKGGKVVNCLSCKSRFTLR